MLQDSQCAHDCRVEADIAVFNMLMTVDWTDSIDQSNAQQFDSFDYQELEIDCDSSWEW